MSCICVLEYHCASLEDFLLNIWTVPTVCIFFLLFFSHLNTNMILYQFQLSIGFCFRNFLPYNMHNIILRRLMTSHRPWLQSLVLQQAEQMWTSPWVRLVWVDLYPLSTLSHIWNINIGIEIWSSLSSTYGFWLSIWYLQICLLNKR
jgi:hypothetical protein